MRYRLQIWLMNSSGWNSFLTNLFEIISITKSVQNQVPVNRICMIFIVSFTFSNTGSGSYYVILYVQSLAANGLSSSFPYCKSPSPLYRDPPLSNGNISIFCGSGMLINWLCWVGRLGSLWIESRLLGLQLIFGLASLRAYRKGRRKGKNWTIKRRSKIQRGLSTLTSL